MPQIHSRLAELLSAKKQESYATTISWVRAKVSFAILRSALLCLRGSRTTRRRNFYVKDRDLEIGMGQAGLPQTQQLQILYYWDVHTNFHFLVYRQLFTFALLKNTRPPRSRFLNYSYTKFVVNFQFERSLIKYVFFEKIEKIIIIIIIIIILSSFSIILLFSTIK